MLEEGGGSFNGASNDALSGKTPPLDIDLALDFPDLSSPTVEIQMVCDDLIFNLDRLLPSDPAETATAISLELESDKSLLVCIQKLIQNALKLNLQAYKVKDLKFKAFAKEVRSFLLIYLKQNKERLMGKQPQAHLKYKALIEKITTLSPDDWQNLCLEVLRNMQSS